MEGFNNFRNFKNSEETYNLSNVDISYRVFLGIHSLLFTKSNLKDLYNSTEESSRKSFVEFLSQMMPNYNDKFSKNREVKIHGVGMLMKMYLN
ncbi:hypothetical protein [Aestuariibaculum sediminum]|uniref:Uncharacterized protein n=1 Tax=Aestuariibaculum sediminum TaxID=2770637 RepID=A0A8J6Q999_9FLAO|nr:hypothetical protein [Aestuariibaculum sediminum]MBD0833405.1 hypothetical protein [Aestuariibaculum sediminum]